MDIKEIFPWLNRIGIMLNFLAGFMLAPELIGLERIRKAQVKLNKSLSSLQNVLMILGSVDEIKDKIITWLLIFIVFFANLGYFLIEYFFNNSIEALVFLILIQIVIIVGAIYNFHKHSSKTKQKSSILFGAIFSIIPFILMAILFFTLYWVTLFVLNGITDFAATKLTKGTKLQGVVVSSGVFFFILGNLLQLIATF